MRKKQWRAEPSPTAEREWHVHPIDDLIAHELDGHDCACGPRTELHLRGWLIIHHSLDGRERTERSPRGQENDS